MGEIADRVLVANARALGSGGRKSRAGRRVAYYLRRAAGLAEDIAARLTVDAQWPKGLGAVAIARSQTYRINTEADAALQAYFDTLIDTGGGWRTPIADPPRLLAAYAMVLRHRARPSERLRDATRHAALATLTRFARESDGCVRYVAHRPELLVDTIGMLCPFLAAYARDFEDPDAAALARNQISRFVERNLDLDTGLPFHAYFADGAARLGVNGWGRGAGWFMIGVADAWIECADVIDDRTRQAVARITRTLIACQRPDGHWGWMIAMPDSRADSSATSFLGYALARLYRFGLLDIDVAPCLERARAAIVASTDDSGRIGGASGECTGIGSYASRFGRFEWAQALGAAFLVECDQPMAAQSTPGGGTHVDKSPAGVD